MKKISTLVVGTALMFASSVASAQMVCGDRDKVIKNLEEKHQEQVIAQAISSNGGLLEVLASPEGKTFTVVYTYPRGKTCLVSSGHNWQEVKPKTQTY